MHKIESYFLAPELSARKALQILVGQISETNQQLELSTSPLLTRASAHLEKAEGLYEKALHALKDEHHSTCHSFRERLDGIPYQYLVHKALGLLIDVVKLRGSSHSFF